ncbi:MAG: hypothetical protein EOP04_18430, partial [Proteobacteria bacterium]
MKLKTVLPLAIFATITTAVHAAPVNKLDSDLMFAISDSEVEWARPTKSAVKFVPYELKDIQTGKAIDPNSTLTLPNGQKVLAGPYYQYINQLSSALASQGYDVRSKTTDFGVIGAAPSTEALKVAQEKSFAASIKSIADFI